MEWIDPKPGDQIVDAGCGTGKLVKLLADKVGPSGSIVGFDPDQERINVAQERVKDDPHAQFHVCSSQNFPWQEVHNCNHVVSNFVTQWMPHEEKVTFLSNVHKVLRPGGLFASTQPCRLCSNIESVASACGFNYKDWFTLDGKDWFQQKLVDAGFEVVKCDLELSLHKVGAEADYLRWMNATFGSFGFDFLKELDNLTFDWVRCEDGTVAYENQHLMFLAMKK